MPLRTPDHRYIIVRGRLWRAANPHLSDRERDALTRALMSARRAVAAAQRSGDPEALRLARRRVHRSKVALGERGPVWWDDSAPDLNRKLIVNTPYEPWWSRLESYGAAIHELLDRRGPDKSVCPSEVARHIDAKRWRSLLNDVRAAARRLAFEGQIEVTQRHETLDPNVEWRGPVRFRRT